MKFDVKAFNKAKFQRRTKEVAVPELAAFFSGLKDNEVPTWRLQSLEANEIAIYNEAADNYAKAGSILEGLLSDKPKEEIQATKDLLGFNEDIRPDIAGRVARLVLGTAEPKIDRATALKISKVAPLVFYKLTNEITHLNAGGHVPGKPQGSTKAKKSSA